MAGCAREEPRADAGEKAERKRFNANANASDGGRGGDGGVGYLLWKEARDAHAQLHSHPAENYPVE